MNEHILNDSELDTHELASCSAGFIKVYDDPNFRGGRTAFRPHMADEANFIGIGLMPIMPVAWKKAHRMGLVGG